MITKEQLQQALDSLPPISQVKGDYYDVPVLENPKIIPINNYPARMDEEVKLFKFVKSRGHWALYSIPGF